MNSSRFAAAVTKRPTPWGRTASARWLFALLLCFLTISITGSALIDTEIPGPYRFIFRYLTLPLLGLCYAIAWFGLPAWRKGTSLIKALCWPGLLALFLLFTSGGMVNYGNALLADGSAVHFSGTVHKLDWASGKGGARYYVVLTDMATGRDIKLHVNRNEYHALHVGDLYERTMKRGGLGYAYQWR